MSLFANLCEVYEENITKEHKGGHVPLLPLYHTVQNAQVEITLDEKGAYLDARLIAATDDGRLTVTPCTESSASRSGQAPKPHPLFDKLKFLTPECVDLGRGRPGAFEEYCEQLTAWCASPHSHPGVKAVLAYVSKRNILNDLARDRVLVRAEDGSFPAKRPASAREGKRSSAAHDIFDACKTDQLDAFVRFQVLFDDEEEDSRLWENPGVWKSWIEYQDSLATERDVCYISGTLQAPSRISPRNIRRPGDGAKLVSSNDTQGYTFRGRFATASEAVSIGRASTEKAHSALRWLIDRQGYRRGDQVVVAWLKHGPFPQLLAAGSDGAVNACREAGWLEPEDDQKLSEPLTGRDFAMELNSAIAGHKNRLEQGEQASIVCLNAATTGRLSVTYYREIQAVDLLDRIASWHSECAWQHRYFIPASDRTDPSKKSKPVFYYGAPSPLVIAHAAYGKDASDKLVAKTIDRLLPCIVDRTRVPRDLIESAARRASRPTSLERWEVLEAQSVACSLIIRNRCLDDRQPTERITMENAKDLPERDIVFGRLLAHMRYIEERSLYRANKANDRITNAERYQERYVSRPASTLQMLMSRLRPHLNRLSAQGGGWCEKAMLEVIDELAPEDMTNKALGPVYLIGYASQYNALRSPKGTTHESTGEDEPVAEGI